MKLYIFFLILTLTSAQDADYGDNLKLNIILKYFLIELTLNLLSLRDEITQFILV